MNDVCRVKTMDGIEIQENGIVRNCDGWIIARLVDKVNFESKLLDASPKDRDHDEQEQNDG